MRYGKIRRLISSILMGTMLTAQVPEVLAADSPEGENVIIETEESSEDAVSNDSVSEDTADDNELIQTQEEDITSRTVLEEADINGDYLEGELLLIAESSEEAEEVADFYGGSISSYSDGLAVISLGDLTVAQAMALELPDGMPQAEPNYIHYVESIPCAAEDDMLLAAAGAASALPTESSWSDWYDTTASSDAFLDPSNSNYQWMHEMINTYAAWGVTTGKTGITVQVLGSGADTTQKDFTDISGNNCRITANAVGDGVPSTDYDGSGTHAAGIIAAGLRNGQKAVGIAPGVSVIGTRIMNENGYITSAAFYSAITAAAGNSSVDIILLTAYHDSVSSNNEAKALKAAYDAGKTIIAGAGDNGSNAKSYPAAYDTVISVGAVNIDGSTASFSNRGSSVDIYAPGVGIASTEPGNQYSKRSGTDSAAAVVAGVAALYMSAGGHVKPAIMKDALLACRKDGIVNAANIFSNDTTGPKLTLSNASGQKMLEVSSGQKTTVSYKVPIDYSISINAMNYNGNAGSDVLVYSTNGKAPVVKDGELTNGVIYNGSIKLSELYDSSKEGTQKVTLIAATITGMGVMSKTTTIIFTIDPDAVTEELSLAIYNPPAKIPLGATITLQAESTGVVKDSIRWKRVSATGITASLNAVTGELSVTGDYDGEVVVQCYADQPSKIESKQVTIEVMQGLKMAGTLDLSSYKCELGYSSLAEEDEIDSYEIRVKELRNTDGLDLRKSSDVTLSWKSSNEKVATVELDEDEEGNLNDRRVWVIPQGKGTATITCTVMDGSGLSQNFKCTVNQLVEEFSINGAAYVIPGKSYTYKADSFIPSNVSNKEVTWSIIDRPEWASINFNSGKLTIKKTKEDIDGESFTIKAVSTDDGNATAEKEITVVSTPASKVVIDTYRDDAYLQIKRNSSGSIKSLNLFTKDVPSEATSGDASRIVLSAESFDKSGDSLDYESSWSSSNSSVVTVSPTADSMGCVVKVVGKGKAVITCKLSDSSRKTAKVTVKVTDPVESISLAGQVVIASGKSAKFKTDEVLPSTAGNKKVTWSLVGTVPIGVSITTGGKVKVNKNVALSTENISVTVRATAKDGSGVYAERSFVISPDKIKTINVNTTATADNYQLVFAKKTGNLTSARLFTQNISSFYGDERSIVLTTDVNTISPLAWTSSNPAVAVVTADATGTNATVTAKKSGSTVITCMAQDGTKKKASVKISVAVPTSGISLLPQDNQSGEIHYLAYGASVQTSAILGSTYGSPTIKNVDWEYDIVTVVPEWDDDENKKQIIGWDVQDNDESETLKTQKIIGFDKGNLTMPTFSTLSKKRTYFEGYEDKNYFCGVVVRAKSKDGTGLSAEQLFIAVPAATKLNACIEKSDGSYLSIGNTYSFSNSEVKQELRLLCQTETGQGEEVFLVSGATVSSSDPSIVSAYFDDENSKLILTTHKNGTAKLTITAKDGKSSKLVVNITVGD